VGNPFDRVGAGLDRRELVSRRYRWSVLEVFAQEVVREQGVSKAVCDELVGAGIGPAVLEPFLHDLVPRASPMGLFGLAAVGLQLVARTDACHGVADAAIAAPGFPGGLRWGLCGQATVLQTEPQILWWHDVFVRSVRDDSFYQRILATHGDLVVARRYGVARDYLLEADRGPGGANVDSLLEILLRTDRPEPFVRRWIEWIRGGRFDWRRRPGDEGSFVLVECLDRLRRERPALAEPLIDETLARWRRQLGDGDPQMRHRGVVNLVGLLHQADRAPSFARRIHAEVIRPADPATVPEWDGLQRVYTAFLYAGDAGGERPWLLFRDAFAAVFERTHRRQP
jgi:hypothetical protein